MNEGDSVLVECSLDNENFLYLGGSETVFDISRYCNSGKIKLFITLKQFIIGSSVIKSVLRYSEELTNDAKLFFNRKEYEKALAEYEKLILYFEKFNDPVFSEVKSK